MSSPLLWHIPLSHYNEKARWALDYKGIAHRRRVLGANYLYRAWRATGQGKLPILWLDGVAIHDSTAIIAAIEKKYPQTPLYPASEAARRRALELEDFFDENLGSALRAIFVGPLFQQDPEIALQVLTTGMPEDARKTIRPILPLFKVFYKFRHRIRDEELEADRQRVASSLDRLAKELQPSGYLVGDSFTVADLTAASLFGPLVRPPQIQYPITAELPEYIEIYRRGLEQHVGFQWVLEMYRRHRGESAELR